MSMSEDIFKDRRFVMFEKIGEDFVEIENTNNLCNIWVCAEIHFCEDFAWEAEGFCRNANIGDVLEYDDVKIEVIKS